MVIESERLKKRIQIVSGCAVLLFGGMVAWSFWGAPARIGTTDERSALIAEYKQKQNKRGSIYDAGMNLIASSPETGTQNRVYTSEQEAMAWGSVVGYSSDRYTQSGVEAACNVLLMTAPDGNSKDGSSLQLTLRKDLQLTLAAQLKQYEHVKGAVGIVMDAETGEIWANVSTPLLNIQAIDSTFAQAQDGMFYNKALLGQIPGSVMKLISARAILKAGKAQEIYTDTGQEFIGNHPIRNYGGASYGAIDLRQGIGRSVNTYFAHMALDPAIRADGLEETWQAFYLTKDIALDFGTLKAAALNARNGDGTDNLWEIAQTAFGQGTATQVSPLHIAMVTATIANNGNMPKPYMVQRVIWPDGKKEEATEPEILQSGILTAQECGIIKDGMRISAERLFGANTAATNSIYSKTGTAEVGTHGERTNQWLTFIATTGGRDFVITLAIYDQPGGSTGSSLGAIGSAIYNALAAEVQRETAAG